MSSGQSTDFVPIVPADEYLHPIADDVHYTSVETSFFGFNVASAGIDGQFYVWMHPKLKVMSIMLFVFKGIKSRQLTADYFNEHVFLPMLDRLDEYRVQMGSCAIHVKVVEPLKEVRIRIDDPRRKFHLDLVTRALFPPVGRPGGGHFTQVMKNAGKLVLNGDPHDIDGYFVRDRSWNTLRGEEPQLGPPYNWMTGIFGDDLAFHLAVLDTTVFDAPQYGPAWDQVVDQKEAAASMRFDSVANALSKNLRAGYWFEGDGTPRKLKSIQHKTHLGTNRYTPIAADVTITDDAGETHVITGRALSFLPKMYGQNIITNNAFMEWTYKGRVGHGELMIVYDNLHLQTLDAETKHAEIVLGRD